MSSEPAPLSKTAKYKKITKPLLERKRRARINRCLDELKDLMVGALEVSNNKDGIVLIYLMILHMFILESYVKVFMFRLFLLYLTE